MRAVLEEPCPGVGEDVGDLPGGSAPTRCVTLVVELLTGQDAGTETAVSSIGDQTGDIAQGDVILVARVGGSSQNPLYGFIDRVRLTPLLILAGIFAVVVVLLGRLRGVAALVALAAATLMLAVFVVPAIVSGRSAVAVAVVGSAAIATVVLYVAHGFTVRTTTALLGTLSGLVCAAILSSIWVPLATLSGLVSDDAFVLRAVGVDVDLAGLLIAGTVIGALGAIDDVAVTQASAVFELREADPALGRRDLYRTAMRVGRDHVGSIVNTLLLAYAGASLPAFLLFELSARPIAEVVNAEIIATEIVRTLTGSIGLVLAVPVATLLAAHAAVRGGMFVGAPLEGGPTSGDAG